MNKGEKFHILILLVKKKQKELRMIIAVLFLKEILIEILIFRKNL